MGPYFDLTGKTIIITGGSKGLGENMGYALAEAGADLALVEPSGACDLAVARANKAPLSACVRVSI